MAVGPSLVSVVPNNGVFLETTNSPSRSARDHVPVCSGQLDRSGSLATGISCCAAAAPTAPLGPRRHGRRVRHARVHRPGRYAARSRDAVCDNLPDDSYQVTLVGLQPSGSTTDPRLKDTSGNPFTVNGVAANQIISFRLDLGAKIEAVVPQPISAAP